jgi:LmbE family N-acetylglucosaminyl deacetylase
MNQKIVRAGLALLFASLLVTAPRAQQTTAAKQSPDDRVALYQALLDLTNPWTVMCIAAHPDDEDGTSLIVMRRKYGAHTVSLFSTFGEGGQNAIGPELYEEMGAIRARETVAAAEIQGSEPHFLGLNDFGFSKSADEAFKFWGHDEALRRMVLQIRKLRPDVIITNHSVTSNDHGQHQATARLTVEAFDAAADPKRFPEQLKDGVTVWQVQRLFVRARGNAQAQAATAPVVTIDPNEQDPVRGVVYAEEALRALQQHATQGPWPKTIAELAARFRNSPDGKLPSTRYVLTRAAKGADALTKDSHNFLDGLRLPERVEKDLDVPTIDGKPLIEFANDRAKVTETLIQHAKKGYHFSSEGADFERSALMQNRIYRALAVAANVIIQVAPSSMFVTPNSHLDLKIKISNTGSHTLYSLECGSDFPSLSAPVDLSKMSGGPTSILTTFSELKGGESLTKDETVRIPEGAPINVPLARHLYEPSAVGLELVTTCTPSIDAVRLGGVLLRLTTPLNVAPPVEIADIRPSPLVITSNTPTSSRSFRITLVNHQPVATTGKLGMTTNSIPGAKFENGQSFSLNANETRTIEVPVGNVLGLQRNGQRTKPPITGTIPMSILLFKGGSRSSSHTLPVQAVITDAQVQPNLRVGYVRGFDYSLPNALTALGVESKELSVDEVKTADLQKYSSIIVDNRVYESEPGLIAANQQLLDYAKAGGTLIVFYHKSFEWNPDPKRNRPQQLAPYKLILGDERITDENAPITFLEPQHPLLNFPNKMGQEDFANWIQERGLYYPKEWDPQFHALLQSNDPGEAPLKGGLLVADYGRGRYIYSSMVWYRELRAGVPGAYRMLANMISYHGKN